LASAMSFLMIGQSLTLFILIIAFRSQSEGHPRAREKFRAAWALAISHFM
jgi:hypothetical protein